MTDYGFTENVDFISLSEKSEKPFGGRSKQDHALKLDMTKKSMIERIDKACIFLRKPHLCVRILINFYFLSRC